MVKELGMYTSIKVVSDLLSAVHSHIPPHILRSRGLPSRGELRSGIKQSGESLT